MAIDIAIIILIILITRFKVSIKNNNFNLAFNADFLIKVAVTI
jgi:hypothetical protein